MERNRQDAGALCGSREPDHGTWSVLVKMFPEANLPVSQLSLDYGTDL
jgi:aromatic ring-opening dioxygenase catalytic subunit (LigB family)